MLRCAWLAPALLALALLQRPLGAEAGGSAYGTCIMGAGPGGLQLGQYLYKAGRDYAIFERSKTAGSFFDRFPIHRQLISVNKRNTGRDNPVFNLRHDWNSLLDNEEAVPLTKRTVERYPDASLLAQYLREFAGQQERAERIAYETTVLSVRRDESEEDYPFTLDVETTGQAPRSVACRVVVSAIGMWAANAPPIHGIELAIGYEELPPTGEMFEGKSVAILGLGNAAFETANAAENYANYVHMWPTRKYGWPYLSWESRYDGNLRAIRANILDGYLLKSLDLLPLGNQIEATPDKMMMHRCYGDKVCMFTMPGREHPQHEHVVIGFHDRDSTVQIEALRELDTLGAQCTRVQLPIGPTKLSVMHGKDVKHLSTKYEGQVVVCPMASVTDASVEPMMRFRNATGEPLGRPYDIVVRATGWNHNVSIYDSSASPLLQSNGKFARMTHEYESVNVPGLYFAGSLTHGKDRGRAVGGVIKGFRHTAKALFHILERKYEREPVDFPCTAYTMPAQAPAMLDHAMRRINESPEMYYMVYTLVDAVLFEKSDEEDAWSATYCESMPFDYVNRVHGHQHRLVVMFGFDGQRRDLDEEIRTGIGFEPWLWYWAPSTTGGPHEVHKEVFRMVEAAHTDWSGDLYANTFMRWGKSKVEEIVSGTAGTQHAAPFGKEKASEATSTSAGRYDMKVMELDLAVVNDLGSEVTLTRTSDARQIRSGVQWNVPASDKASFVLPLHSPAQKVTTRDGEVWQAEYTHKGRKQSSDFTVDFRWGIFQEIYLSEVHANKVEKALLMSGAGAADNETGNLPKVSLHTMKARELKDMLEARELDTRGTKSKLIERLESAMKMEL